MCFVLVLAASEKFAAFSRGLARDRCFWGVRAAGDGIYRGFGAVAGGLFRQELGELGTVVWG
jgi:hypothetical protein